MHRLLRRGWIVPVAIAAVAAHVLVPYFLFRRAISVAALSVALLLIAKHAAAAATVWWARRRR